MLELIKKLISRINNTKPCIINTFIFIYLTGISLIIKSTFYIRADLSEYLNNPLRVINGDLPYRDFWLLFTPGEVYFPALIFKIFGVNIDYVCILSLIASSITACVVFQLSKHILKNNIESAILAIIFYYTSVIFNYEGPYYIHLYLTFSLISAIYLVKYIKNDNKLSIFLSGIFLGIAFFFKFYEVGAIAFAFVLTLIIYFIINKITFKISLKSLSLFLLGNVIIFAITLLSFYTIIPKMISEVLFESVKNGTSMNMPYFYRITDAVAFISIQLHNVIYLHDYSNLEKIFTQAFSIIPNSAHYILPFFSIILMILYIYTKPNKYNLIVSIMFFLWAMGSFPKGLGRSDINHLAPTTAPLLFILFIFIQEFYIKIKSNGKNVKIEKIIYYTSLIFIFLFSLQILYPYLRIKKILTTDIPTIHTQHGNLSFADKTKANDFQSTLNFIEKYSKPDDYIFVTIWDVPSMYSLANRRNPTYYDSMNDLIVRPSIPKQIKLCNDLVAKKTKIIIHNPDWGYDTPDQYFSVACSYIQNFITSHYRLVARYGEYYIYMEK